MRITLQVARIKVDLLVSELILLSLELEELFTIHDGPSRRASTRTATTASREKCPHIGHTLVQRHQAKPYPLPLSQGTSRLP